MKRLPDAEFDVMACIWQCDAPVTSGEIMRRMGSERGWKTPALITLLNRLIERGFLRSEQPAGCARRIPAIRNRTLFKPRAWRIPAQSDERARRRE